MTAELHKLVEICDHLPEALQSEVTAFARSLLAKVDAPAGEQAFDRWLASAAGGSTSDVTSDEVMALTRSDS